MMISCEIEGQSVYLIILYTVVPHLSRKKSPLTRRRLTHTQQKIILKWKLKCL
jgi:hypothetical protein